MDIKALQWELAAFVVDRGLDPLHTPKNLAMALAAESGALLSLFKWANDDGHSVNPPEQREAAADAIADSVLHAVHLADRLGIDLDEAIRRKLAKNAERYPIAVAERQSAPLPGRRNEPEKRSPPPRKRASAEREASAPPATRSAAPAPPPAREAPRPVQPASPPTVAEPPRPLDPPPAQAARAEAPPPPPPPEPAPPSMEEIDPYAKLDPDAARRLVDALSKQVNRARSDDPLARELYDELTTLKRTLYAENPKRAWLAGSLRSIRRILDEACSHSVGAELRAADHLAEVERILKE